MKKLLLPLLCTALWTGAAAATPHYRPQQSVAGTIRIWGDEHMADMVRLWAAGFRRYQPGVQFAVSLKGSGTAMPGIYHEVADLALLGRESDLTDDNGFFKSVGGYPPLRLELMAGSLDAPGKSDAPVVLVHKDNPLAKMTVAELEAVFGHEHRRGARTIRTWGDLGLEGEWKDQAIALFAPDAESEAGVHFTRTVLLESRKMNWEHLSEFADTDGEQLVGALRQQRYGMALANIRYATKELKALPIAANEAAPYVYPSKASVSAHSYPLARHTYAFVNRKPGKPVEPALKEFLRYVLSSEGQAKVVQEGGYLPLPPALLDDQRKKLD